MTIIERIIVFGAFGILALWMILGSIVEPVTEAQAFLPYPRLAITAFIFNGIALLVVFVDLYRRPFKNPGAKVFWLFAMFFTSGLAVVVYVFKYAFKPCELEELHEADV